MSFLTDDNLTFHRFADARLSFSNQSTPNRLENTNTTMDAENYQNPKQKARHLGRKNSFSPAVWTTQTKMNCGGLDSTNEFHFMTPTQSNPNDTSRQNNGSTTKLIIGGNQKNKNKKANSLDIMSSDQSSKQVSHFIIII